MIKKSIQFILLLLITCSCGSGTFENDPKSWNKVFGEDIPEEIEVRNSRFWKSMHWSYEFEFFAKIKSDKSFLKEYFIDHYELNKSKIHATLFLEEIPNWFLSDKDYKDFEIWEGGPNSITLFLDKKEDIAFIHILQI